MICHFGGDIFPGPGYLAMEMKFKNIKPVIFDKRILAIGEVTDMNIKRKRVIFSMKCYNEQDEMVLEGYIVGGPYKVKINDNSSTNIQLKNTDDAKRH